MTSPDVMCQVVDVSASYTGFFVLFVIAVVISVFSIRMRAPENDFGKTWLTQTRRLSTGASKTCTIKALVMS
jgi:hypothetical protein